MASSTNAVAGSSTMSATAWSASQGWAGTDSRPVSTSPPVAGRSTTAPSRGCPSSPSPAGAEAAGAGPGSGQYQSRWNA